MMQTNPLDSRLHFGYARVSTDNQELAMQIDALKKAGCHRIYSEVVSSRRAVRPQLEECLNTLRSGDTLTVWRMDRLGRSLAELIKIITSLHERHIAFNSLTEQIDTSTAAGNLMFHVFAALAEFERNVIRERTRAGLASARARGRQGGRKKKYTGKIVQEIHALYDSRQVSIADICKRYGISKPTMYRAMREFPKKEMDKANE